MPLKDLKIVIGLIKNIEQVSSAGNGVLFLKVGRAVCQHTILQLVFQSINQCFFIVQELNVNENAWFTNLKVVWHGK